MFRGRVIVDKKTKNLVKRIKPGQIAVIDHKDLDQVAAQSLVECQVKAVLNKSQSISGKYPNQGPMILLKSGIIVLDITHGDIFSLKEGTEIIIKDNQIYNNKEQILAQGIRLKLQDVEEKLKKAKNNLNSELNKFIDNTLTYASTEKELILDIPIPDIELDFKNRQVLVVARGIDYKEDLKAIESYIKEVQPIIIAVDGGADACLVRGYQSDIIIGDMDSVSDKALKSGAKIIVHAYADGRAPGLDRVESLGIKPIIFPAPGTSEDIALILAYEKGADLITAVGTHSHMIDFLEKGRAGMASTLLVRLKIGDRFVDAKGVSKLYQSNISYQQWFLVLLAILLPLGILGFFSPPLKQLFQLLALRLSLIFNF